MRKSDFYRKLRKRSWRFTRGIASEYIASLKRLVAREVGLNTAPGVTGRLVVLYCRESSCKQQARGNLKIQIDHMVETVEALGCRIAKHEDGEHCIFKEVVTADIRAVYDNSPGRKIRRQLERAIDCARHHGAVLVAYSRDRLLRHSGYNGTNETDEPTIWELKLFEELADGVTVATILDPDTPSGVVRGFQIKLGQAKKSKGGRPPKHASERKSYNARRKRLRTIVKVLYLQGWSLRPIMKWVNGLPNDLAPLSHETVRRWGKASDTLLRCE